MSPWSLFHHHHNKVKRPELQSSNSGDMSEITSSPELAFNDEESTC